jgi:hypothetical protein
MGGGARSDLALDVEPENVHEILGIRDYAERLMSSPVLELAHDKLR